MAVNLASIPLVAVRWVTGRDTGISSLAIWRHMTGSGADEGGFRNDAPWDADDFGRCYRLLALVPEWRARMGEMAVYPKWARIAPEWERLTALYERDLHLSGREYHGRSRDLYTELHRLREVA